MMITKKWTKRLYDEWYVFSWLCLYLKPLIVLRIYQDLTYSDTRLCHYVESYIKLKALICWAFVEHIKQSKLFNV